MSRALHPASGFLPTRWSLILAATGPTPAAALEELARTYWYPLYAYIRRHGNSPADAEDLTQEFFSQLLEKKFLAAANQSHGRFRAFLLACLKHFLSHQRDKARTQKRGGNTRTFSLDTAAAESRFINEPAAPPHLTPDRLFERRWALDLLSHVLTQLEADYARNDQLPVFNALKHTLTSPTADAPSYAALAKSLHTTEPALKTAAHRLRRRYRDLLRAHIATTVDSPDQIDEEITYLLNSL